MSMGMGMGMGIGDVVQAQKDAMERSLRRGRSQSRKEM